MKGKHGTSGALVKRVSLGVLVSLGIMMGVCAVGAGMISSGTLQEHSGGYISAVALLLGGIMGALVTARGSGSQRMLLCAIHGACCFVVLFCLGILLYPGVAQGMGSTALLCLGSSCATGLATLRKKGRRAPGRHHYKIRTLVQNAQ